MVRRTVRASQVDEVGETDSGVDGATVGYEALQREFTVLERLAGIDGVPRAIRLDPVHRELVIDDPDGIDIASAALHGRLEWPDYLALATAFARILGAVHERGVVHRHVAPSTLKVATNRLQASLVGFGRATVIASEVDADADATADPDPGDLRHAHRVGDLAFLSPEQTGRMNRQVDARSDLYALGVVLYQLATGELPFADRDPLALLHAHLARLPRPAHLARATVPPLLSAVLGRLLHKEPDARYQTAASLARDLALLADNRLRAADIDRDRGEEDGLPTRPSRLVGLAAAQALVRDRCEQAAAGTAGVLWIAGPSGVGKTTLAQQAARWIAEAGGWFVGAGIDRMQRHLPFAAPLQLLDQICGRLLAGGADAIARDVQDIRQAVRPHGAVLTGLSPSLAALIGEQPPASAMTPQDSQNRLIATLRALVGAVARADRPLVLFVDDLQRADLATIAFLEALASHDDLQWLLVIGAWRDDDVPPEHPLRRMADRLAQRSGSARTLSLGPLGQHDLSLLVADVLSRPVDQVVELSGRLHAQTGGNPHHAIELIQSLQLNGVFPATAAAQGAGPGDPPCSSPCALGLPDLLARRLAELDPALRTPLCWAATLGHEFDLGSLRLVVDDAEPALRQALSRLHEAGVLMPSRRQAAVDRRREDAAAAAEGAARPGAAATAEAAVPAAPDADASWCFTSGDMQQAAYALIEHNDRAAWHRRCARRLSATGRARYRMAVATHYAQAIDLVADPATALADERAAAAQHFARAASAAIGTADMPRACFFIDHALRLRPVDAWAVAFESTFALEVDRHAVLHGLDRHDEADAVFAQLERRSTQPLQMVAPTCVQLMSLCHRRRFEAAVRLGAALLRRLGVDVPADENVRSAALAELERFDAMAQALPLERLAEAHEADGHAAETARLLGHLALAAFPWRPELAFWLVLRCSRLWVERGFAEAMIMPMAGVMVATIGLRDDFRGGWRAVRLAMHASQLRITGPAASRVYDVYGLVASHWFEPLEHSIPYARIAFERAMKSGDLETACHASFVSQAASLEVATHLDLADKEIAAGLRVAARIDHPHASDAFLALRNFVRILRVADGASDGGSWDRQVFHDDPLLESPPVEAQRLQPDDDDAPPHGDPCGAAVFHIYRAWSACLFFDTLAAGRHVRAMLPLSPFVTGFYPAALACVSTCLLLIDEAPCRPWIASHALVERIAWLERRAADMPANFLHLLDLVEARRAAAEGRSWQAASRFDLAMRRSAAARRTLHHALTVESAGRFHLEQGLRATGQHLLRKALALWRRWGAQGKVAQLQQRFPFLVPGEPATGGLRANGAWHGDIDRLAILRASQALSSETDLDRLVPQIVQVIAQLSGATAVCLLFDDEHAGRWSVVGGVRDGVPLDGLPRPMEDAAALGLSRGMVRHAVQVVESEVIDDVANDERFMHDPAIAGTGGASMLWVPVRAKGVVQAVLILENRLATRFFTAEHLELLQVITAQLSISIENARLYRSLEQRVSDRTRALAVRTERLNAVFELSPDGFVLLDADDRVSIVNPAFERMTGLATASLLGLDRHAFEQRLTDLCGGLPAQEAVPPQFAETHPPASAGDPPGARDAGRPEVARQSLLHLQKPQPRTLLRRVRRGPPAPGADGGNVGRPETVMYFRDMTRELEIDRMKSDFLSTAAHELRTPMTSIYGFAELLIKRPMSLEQHDDLLHTIHRQAGTLIDLINELLDLARIEARRGKDFRPRRQLLQPIVRSALSGLMIRDDPRTVVVDLRQAPAWVNVDADKLSMAITNVVSNAYKYSVSGDITLALVERTLPSRGQAEPVDQVGVRVADQGIGMTQDQLSRLFEPFFRVDDSGRVPGTGLGTSIVKEVIEQHGGQVEVVSAPGEGTVFTMWLPVHRAPSIGVAVRGLRPRDASDAPPPGRLAA